MTKIPLMTIPLKISLSKESGFTDLLPGFLWSKSAGPLENLFKIVNIPLIMFSGGTFSMVLIALSFLGWNISDLGKAIDEALNLKGVSDLASLGPEKIANTAANILNEKMQQKVEASRWIPPLIVFAAGEIPDPVEFSGQVMTAKDWDKAHKEHEALMRESDEAMKSSPKRPSLPSIEERKVALQEERQKRQFDLREKQIEESTQSRLAKEEARTKLDREKFEFEKAREETKERVRQLERAEGKEESLRKEKAAEKEMRAREKSSLKLEKARLAAGRGLSSGGKAALGLGLAGIFGWLWKLFTDKSSWVSRFLRGGAAVAGESVSTDSKTTQTGRARHQTAPSTSKTTNYQTKLQQVVDDILQ